MGKELSFIKSHHKPTMKLYRYFSNIEHALEEIESGEIYCSLSDMFNDIFDCRVINDGKVLDADYAGHPSVIIPFVNSILLDCKEFFFNFFLNGRSFEDMEAEFIKSISNKAKIKPSKYLHFVYQYSERQETFERFYSILRASYIKMQPLVSMCRRVACFSEINDSILMWSYYTDKHKGLCLEYDPNILDDGVEEHENMLNAIQKVQYSETQYNNPKYFRSSRSLNNIYFTKALCWAHEQEWRIVLQDNVERIKFPCLTGVYLGANFRLEHDDLKKDHYFIRLLKACMKKSNVAVYEAIQDSEKYKINFSEIIPTNREWEK